MTIQLKGGVETNDPRLDRVYQLDLRSLNYLVPKATAFDRKPRSYTWEVGTWLDQGAEGACVGFGYSHDLLARPVPVIGVSNQYAREHVYWGAQQIDEWEGGSYPGANPTYEGSSVLAGAKVCTSLGFYSEYRWAITAQDVAGTIGYEGPSILGLNWWTNMFNPDKDGFLRPTGKIEGGHCICAYAVKFHFKGMFSWFNRSWENVDYDKSYIKVWNSWGPSWGENGTAKISLRDLSQLIEGEHGEACFPKRVSKKLAVV